MDDLLQHLEKRIKMLLQDYRMIKKEKEHVLIKHKNIIIQIETMVNQLKMNKRDFP